MADWEINKTLGQCAGTDEPFEIGQEYFAALVQTEEGLERRDFSIEYWQEKNPDVYCFWKTKMPDPIKRHATKEPLAFSGALREWCRSTKTWKPSCPMHMPDLRAAIPVALS